MPLVVLNLVAIVVVLVLHIVRTNRFIQTHQWWLALFGALYVLLCGAYGAGYAAILFGVSDANNLWIARNVFRPGVVLLFLLPNLFLLNLERERARVIAELHKARA